LDPARVNTCPAQTDFEPTADDTKLRILAHTLTQQAACQNVVVQNSKEVPHQDICLGVLQADNTWTCIFDRTGRLTRPVWTTDSGRPSNKLSAMIERCDGTTTFAFIHSPLPPASPGADDQFSFWHDWGRVVVIVVTSVGGFSLLIAYILSRLVRYRRKYKENVKKETELKKQRDYLDENAGGLGIADDEIDMMANPLVIELQNLEVQIRKVNEEMGVQEERDRKTMERLETERRRVYAEIERVREAMTKAETETEAAAKAAAAAASATATVASTAAPADMGVTVSVDGSASPPAGYTAARGSRLSFGMAKVKPKKRVGGDDL